MKRQRFADRLSKSIGVILVLLVLLYLALQTTILSVIPFPKALTFQGDHEEFIECFEQHATLADVDGVTSYRRDVTRPENRIRLAQVQGFLRASASRAMFIDLGEDHFQIVDGYYENRHERSRPIRKYDMMIGWLCGTGNL
ncbi:hypothetical protein [Cochlodiniinecator piscidefendens]|uniref:hypothetical protein n=1 Tax=Cochlodiniinecator piscidefendens TaxID=2715756 RepID=UPI00140C5FBD|nr:hypothetical protein [Cochlodiniinecator piscidefendens]